MKIQRIIITAALLGGCYFSQAQLNYQFSEKISISPNGNVGIGIINPAHKFVVDDGEVQANGIDDDGDGFTDENDPVVIVNNRGRVGIGNTAPGACLDIQNTGDNPPAQLLLARNAAGAGRFRVDDGGALRASNGVSLQSGTFATLKINLLTFEIQRDISSLNVKENIDDVSFDRDMFFMLQPRSFTWKPALGSNPGIGLVAEEVANVMPQLAVFGPKEFYNSDGSPMLDSFGNHIMDTTQLVPVNVDFNAITTYMLAILKDYRDSIADLKTRLTVVENVQTQCCNNIDSSASLRLTNNNYLSNASKTKEKYYDNINNPMYTAATSITLEHAYLPGTVGAGIYPLYLIELGYSGMKYGAFNPIDSGKLVLYNLDYSIFKEINLPTGVAFDVNYGHPFYISENLFDTDSAIEYLVQYGGANPSVKIYNEDGSILWEETDCTPGCEIGFITAGTSDDKLKLTPIVNTDMGTKMIIHCNVPQQMPYFGDATIKVYGLPGSLMIGQTGLEVYNNEVPQQFLIYPNPSVNGHTTIEYILPQGESKGEVVISNLTGGMVKKVAVNSSSGKIELDNTQLPSGTYFYQLQTAKGVAGTKKMILVK